MSAYHIQGRKIATRILADIREAVETLARPPRLRVIAVGTNAVTASYVRMKERRAADVGILFTQENLPESISPREFIARIRTGAEDALVVQLPLPPSQDTETFLAAIPEEKDADVLSPAAFARFARGEKNALIPPVAFAVQQILADAHIDPAGTRAVVVGDGRLVGKPVAAWLIQKGADVRVITRERGSLSADLPQARIIVSGTGSPHLIKPWHIAAGAVLIDAGTAESDGVIVGDIDPACEGKASVFTPVPGGVGPLTIAGLLANVVSLAARAVA